MHSLAHGNTNYSETRNVTYAYDLMNRLTNVDDANIDSFDEVFTYDPQGRIKSQRRAASVTNTAGGEYDYYANTNKLKKVSAGMSSAVDSARIMNADSNFVYDADGNMIYDASKKMAVSYDYRGLPTAFAKQELSGDSVRLLMTYDGAGNRISKRYERKAAAETVWTLQLATHYTGLGSEIRENGLDNTAKVVVNLPQGLGRYGVENAVTASATTPGFEWYLKNHLGSTLLVYGTDSGSASVKAAYDYRAFGEQLDITMPLDKVTETFTGKERDDETALNYVLMRYLDPSLGAWVSVDAKRQFPSPYLYAGNGYNPVNSIDYDGSIIIVANPAQGEQFVGWLNSMSTQQYEYNNGQITQSVIAPEQEGGSSYYSERINSLIESKNVVLLSIGDKYLDNDGVMHSVKRAGEGLTAMTEGADSKVAQVYVTGNPSGLSSVMQNLMHEIVGHVAPFLLDEQPTSAYGEENKVLKETGAIQEVDDGHLSH